MRNPISERRTLFFQKKYIRSPSGEPPMVVRYAKVIGYTNGWVVHKKINLHFSLVFEYDKPKENSHGRLKTRLVYRPGVSY